MEKNRKHGRTISSKNADIGIRSLYEKKRCILICPQLLYTTTIVVKRLWLDTDALQLTPQRVGPSLNLSVIDESAEESDFDVEKLF